MESGSRVQPGFRFHPTEEELVDYYLRKKVGSPAMELEVIKDVDIYKIDPWDLQEACWRGGEAQSEGYFFSQMRKKYPTGRRSNRATPSGSWKASGEDKPVYSKQGLIGTRKILVFYNGHGKDAQKSDWTMHEYRLKTEENGPPQEEGWVVCRLFKKNKTTTNKNINSIDPRIPMMGGDQGPRFNTDGTSFMQSEITNGGYFHPLPPPGGPGTLQASPLSSQGFNLDPCAMIIGANHPNPLRQMMGLPAVDNIPDQMPPESGASSSSFPFHLWE